MARYIEYDTISGRIISEIKALKPPRMSDGMSFIEVDEDAEIETSLYLVKDGKLVKAFKALNEETEQERIKREYAESVRLRVKSMEHELCVALLAEDDEEIARLKREYKNLEAYL